MSKPSLFPSTPPSSGLGSTVYQFLEAYFKDHKGDLPCSGLYQIVLQEIEKPLIEITLNAVEGNQKKASEILGINRNTLRKKMQDLGLKSGK
jgi:two-component system nitrogen regulation response regulator GlnG